MSTTPRKGEVSRRRRGRNIRYDMGSRARKTRAGARLDREYETHDLILRCPVYRASKEDPVHAIRPSRLRFAPRLRMRWRNMDIEVYWKSAHALTINELIRKVIL